jgi:hypothetical protein
MGEKPPARPAPLLPVSLFRRAVQFALDFRGFADRAKHAGMRAHAASSFAAICRYALSWFARLNGKPMVKESVGNFFADACKMAGIYGKSGHGVRKAAATQAAENEATTAQMNSIFGWEGDAMVSLYMKSANRTKIAAGAIEKVTRTKTATPKPPPAEKVGALGRKGQTKNKADFLRWCARRDSNPTMLLTATSRER